MHITGTDSRRGSKKKTHPKDRDKWVSAKEAELLSLVVAERSASRLALCAGEEDALGEVRVPKSSRQVMAGVERDLPKGGTLNGP